MLSKLSRWPMLNPMTTEQRIAELQTSVRYSRTSVSRERVMSDWRIAMANKSNPSGWLTAMNRCGARTSTE